MSDYDSYNGYTTNADKCPNCGATKVFSALVCPACGMSYSDAADARKKAAEKPKYSFLSGESGALEEEVKPKMTSFDPNASFASYKKTINGDEEAAGEETGNAGASAEAAPTTEVADIPLDRAPVNSGLYGERKYRVGDDLSHAPIMGISDKRPEGEPDKTVVPTRYGLDSETVKQKREQSLSDDARTAKMFSTTVSNRYEQYKKDTGSSYDKPSYATPYNRGSFDAAPEKKPSVLRKIIPLAIVLILVLVVGFFVMRYMNRNKNDKGVEYTTGGVVGEYFVNDWAEVKLKLDSRMHYGTEEIFSVNLMNSMFKSVAEKMDLEIEINMMDTYNNNVAVMMMTVTDTRFLQSIFGPNEDDFLEGEKVGSVMSSGSSSYRREPDMTLGSHTYKAVSGECVTNDGTKGRMYVGVRKIGFKIVMIALYEIPGATDITTLKKYFENY